MYKRILAIGDIHGEYDKFQSLYRKIEFNPPDDLLVFLGDYVDRGGQPLHVMGWMLKNRRNPHIVMLRGNHDQMMLDFYKDKETQRAMGGQVVEQDYGEYWLENGGDKTRNALDDRALATPCKANLLRERWLALTAAMPLAFQVEAGDRRFFFCHAGIDPKKPLDMQDAFHLLWGKGDGYTGDATIVVGHIVREKPLVTPRLIMTDTGACYGGPLSCVDVLSGQVRQSD